MITVDAYFSYIQCTQPFAAPDKRDSMNEFICKLADEMIKWDGTTRSQRASYSFNVESPPSSCKRPPIDVNHLTPTKRYKPKNNAD